MDKQKQIEEIAKVMCGGCHNGKECMRCLCADWYRAEMLYDANYRKIDEDSVVISKEEYEILTDISALKGKVQEALNINPIEELRQVEREARKETAREILKDIDKELYDISRIYVEAVAKDSKNDNAMDKYGVMTIAHKIVCEMANKYEVEI